MLQPRVTVVVFLLVQPCEVYFQKHPKLICSSQPIKALAGVDVIFPCHLEPPIDASAETLEWTRPDLDEKYIYIQRDGQPVFQRINPRYLYRTVLPVDQLENGNVSLKLRRVSMSDKGEYICSLRSLQQAATIKLIVVSHEEESELISSHQPIVALVGGNVTLPCHLEPPIDASSETVVWTKPDIYPKYVHVHHQGRPVCVNQNPWYEKRTALCDDELEKGNLSLQLSAVQISDAGEYKCYIQSIQNGSSIQIIVGAVSMPIIKFFSNHNGSVVLWCESEGWHPEPEAFWLDTEGNVLSAGPTETVRGPGGLYNVSSRLTVDRMIYSYSNNFTCRVQQTNINQTRETQIHIPADLFMVQSSSHLILCIIIPLSLIAAIIIIIIRKMKCIKSNQETVRQNSRISRFKADFLELLDVQQREVKDQEATAEGRGSADHQRELQEEDIMDTLL